MALREFHCIMPIANVASVMKYGLLSYERAKKLKHRSVAMPDIQERRDMVRIPGGRKLHHYAHLYLDARNPMISKRKNEAGTICILRISTRACHIEGAVFADRNASSCYVRFLAFNQVDLLDLEAIYSRDWRYPDEIAYFIHKSKKCAEFLVPDRLPPEFIEGAFVVNIAAKRHLQEIGFILPIEIDADLFFS